MNSIAWSLVNYTERVLSSMHLSAVKTIGLVMWAMALVRKPNLSEWARQLRLYQVRPDGSSKAYGFKYKKFRLWRFLTRSLFKFMGRSPRAIK